MNVILISFALLSVPFEQQEALLDELYDVAPFVTLEVEAEIDEVMSTFPLGAGGYSEQFRIPKATVPKPGLPAALPVNSGEPFVTVPKPEPMIPKTALPKVGMMF